ncbi:ribosome biogenesis GTPase Der [Flavipsychrobacter stenotrophus]|uniref:GTPase Der n=1 Tax=Flavipsychrobacter stenotrophus TaxID=2077091 RepID=A0A2S7T1D5_9BACT|nr:ribosome biogenesis GTPase Der [Flavipsychrobacter stenotrophus]PQJ12764.1 ribosome biogenesis GTPase Der [Flavipsychrobacter stenotrophus]
MSGFTVAIVGRPNVGKSTLFNRLLEQRKAIVDDVSGVTRDRQYGIADWAGKVFNVIDTGGFVSRSEDVFEREIRKQVHIAVDEADLILFVCDTTTGITGQDQDMADLLRRSTKPVLLVVNKVDNPERALYATEFYSLGFDNTFMISSISGSGSGELLDEVVTHIKDDEEPTENLDAEGNPLPKFAIIGQPNAGKSTLLNALINQERTIVSDIAGTTRDTIHTHYKLFGKEFMLIDTAGIRKKKNVHEDLEFYSVIRAIRAMDEADVCMMLIDASVGVTAQDVSIFSLATRKGKGVVVLVNKWDLVPKETNTARDYEKMLKERMAPFTDFPVIFVSASEKTRIFQGMEKALEVFENRTRRIATSVLNEVMLKEIENFPPPMTRGYAVKIKFVQQVPTHVPSFAFYCNHPDSVKKPYENFLENKIRAHFSFSGVPVRIFMRQK